jgi:hypothetical protein
MGSNSRYPFFRFAAVSFGLALVIPATTYAAGNSAAPASPNPRPDREIKVWTNDNIVTLGPPFEPASQSTSSVTVVPELGRTTVVAGSRAPLNPQQDPQWYAGQSNALSDELASISAKIDQLRQFRATSSGLPTGLNIVAPCEGVGTDNQIAQLEARRQEIEQQINALGDTAQQNGISSAAISRAATMEAELTPAQARAQVVEQYNNLSAQLAETQEVVAVMHEEAAANGATLLPARPGDGGNQTTNLLQQLARQASEAQTQLSAVEDDARHLGVNPATLRQ